MTKQEAIRRLIEAGYTLIPLRPKSKIPARKDWTDTKKGQYDAASLPDNYGVALQADDLIVDVDPRNFTKGDNPVSRLCEALGGDSLHSFTVRTGGGGVHIYFKKPADVAVVGALTEYPGIEFKSAGRQVVGPGSIHPESSKSYDVAVDELPAAQIPEALLNLIRKPDVPYFELNAGLGKYTNDASTQARFSSYLQDVAVPSVEGHGGDLNAFRVAAHGRDLGLPPATVLDLMLEFWNDRCAPPWDAEELKAKVLNAYRYASNVAGNASPEVDFTVIQVPRPFPQDLALTTTAQGATARSFANLLAYLQNQDFGLGGVFGYNEFTAQVEFLAPAPWHNGSLPRGRAVDDDDIRLLKAHFALRHKFEMPLVHIQDAVIVTARSYAFHPIRDYLNSLRWDGKRRLDTWLRDFGGAEDTAYVRACARKVLCAAVARVFHPGVKFDSVLVLLGAQGIGKSGICRVLGGAWAGDFSIDPSNKDTIQLMQGQWIIELAELEVTRKTDMDALKAFLTRQFDKARLAYGRLAKEFPRQSIFVATKNPESDGTFLKDDTGNRRWWPVELAPRGGKVDFAGLNAARDQLFAEARVRFEEGKEGLYMDTKELSLEAARVADEHRSRDPWTDRIATWASGIPEDREFLSASEVFCEALGGIDKQFDRRAMLRIASVLRDLGWERQVTWKDGRPARGWKRPAWSLL